MLLKKLSLYNFRQFKGLNEITFATDEQKNVTIVMAPNGVGKTTLAQAFQWVLYASTDGFKNKTVLNLKVQEEISKGSGDKVKVELVLVHNDIEYTISRTQEYSKNFNGEVKSNPTESVITYLTKDGQTDFIKDIKVGSTISNILPEQLSKYFFFDGERIEKMSAEIKSGRSKEFAEAVQGLLGLTALLQAMDHLKPNSKDSVIGKYDSDIDQFGDQKTKELREKIYKIDTFLEEANSRIDEIDSQLRYYREDVDKVKNNILEFAEAEKHQNLLNRLDSEVKREEIHKNELTSTFINHFSKNTVAYFLKKPIQEALTVLAEADKIDKGIPDVRDKTIKFLLDRKKCICGCDLSDPTSDPVKHLLEELDYLPPKSIGTMISQFAKESSRVVSLSSTYYNTAKSQIGNIRNSANIINEKQDQISEIDKTLLRTSNAKVAELKQRQIDMEKTISRLDDEKRKLEIEIGIKTNDRTKSQSDISELQLIDERNKVIEIQRQYAIAAYDKIKTTYEYQENLVRETLEDTINSLFKQIYSDGMAISIDNKYNVKLYVNELKEYGNNVDQSTAQSYSVIFAFIVGIISMAKNKNSEDGILVDTESYPLVMDAPLSAFDEKRINNICNVIPSIARQVIIFIKDTDGKIARQNLSSAVGQEYQLLTRDNTSLVETYIVKRGEN